MIVPTRGNPMNATMNMRYGPGLLQAGEVAGRNAGGGLRRRHASISSCEAIYVVALENALECLQPMPLHEGSFALEPRLSRSDRTCSRAPERVHSTKAALT
jgi:hypothetical protein